MSLLSTGCRRVYYRFHDFEPAVVRDGRMSIDVVMTGSAAVEDSAGRLVERRGSPYEMRLYVTSPSDKIEVPGVRLVAVSTGVQIHPTLSPLLPLDGDSLQRLHAVTDEITLPYDDYTVEVRVRFGDGAGAREKVLTGRLRKRFEQSDRNLFWERLMSM
jgi:hypothetical protein